MDDHADFGQFLRVGVFLIGVVKGRYIVYVHDLLGLYKFIRTARHNIPKPRPTGS